MLRHVLFDMKLFDGESDRANSQKRVLWLLEALTRCDQLYLQNHPETPLIYQSGIKYVVPAQVEQADVPEISTIRAFLASKGAPTRVMQALESLYSMCGGGEIFREIPRILQNGGGDCDNVASWRAAELRELGIDACPFITWRTRPDGGMTYHVVVRWPDDTIEDPSLLLGMGGAERESDRAEEERKLGERMGNFMRALQVGGTRTANAVLDAGASDQAAHEVLGGAMRRARARIGARTKQTLFGVGAINSPQDFNQLQYSIPFQTDDALYEDWSPTRPQAYFFNEQYPNLPTTKGGGPIFNTLLGMASARTRREIKKRLRRSE